MRILAFNITHDSSVASIHDGKLEFFCKEERLTRLKRDSHPFESIKIYKKLNFGKIDKILYCTPTNDSKEIYQAYRDFLQKTFDQNIPIINFSSLQHHLCHAALSYFNSKFEKSLIFVIDRDGSVFFVNELAEARESESVFFFDKSNFNILYKSFYLNNINHKNFVEKEIKKYYQNVDINVQSEFSIVKVYEAATTLINQHPLENGKTMGLSSYGKNENLLNLIENFSINDDYFTHINLHGNYVSCFKECESLIQSNFSENNFEIYANFAKNVQQDTQNAVLRLIEKYTKSTNIKNVCIVGGYGLNILANAHYLKNLSDINFYFEPVADDTGISIGAAMLEYYLSTGIKPLPVKNNFYHYWDNSEIIPETKNIKKTNLKEISRLLIEQKSVAVYDTAPEAGPRALGHRSILFDARNKDAKNIINKIKKREWYRPFAGVILEDHFDSYFDTLGLKNSPYMTVNFECKQHTKDLVAGIIHVDNTCRIQTVKDGFLYDLLLEFYKLTGCPMLLNTSFNLAGQPLVQYKQDALLTFEQSELDYLYFVQENNLIFK